MTNGLQSTTAGLATRRRGLTCAGNGAHDRPTIAKNQMVGRPRFRRLVHHLHDLGGRPTGEFLTELGRAHGIDHEIADLLEQYAALDPALVERLGGRDWAPRALEPVP
jgi:hypothetical protein